MSYQAINEDDMTLRKLVRWWSTDGRLVSQTTGPEISNACM